MYITFYIFYLIYIFMDLIVVPYAISSIITLSIYSFLRLEQKFEESTFVCLSHISDSASIM